MTMLHHLSLAHYFPILQTLICMVVCSMYVYVNTSLIYGPPLWVKVFIVIILPSVHNNVKSLQRTLLLALSLQDVYVPFTQYIQKNLLYPRKLTKIGIYG